MALPPSSFHPLEKAILEWIAHRYQSPTLSQQIAAATFNAREWTKVGYYVALQVPHDLPPVDLDPFKGYWPIDGPIIQSSEIEFDGDSILWGTKEGYIDCIEMYSLGSFFREDVQAFTLTSHSDYRREQERERESDIAS